VVVVEGIHDQNKAMINVTKVYKPSAASIPRSTMIAEELRKMTSESYRDRPVQVMVACGPYTFKNSL
jgi:hypothetical protein